MTPAPCSRWTRTKTKRCFTPSACKRLAATAPTRWGGLLNINGTLYGTTQFGGPNSGDGTVFAINHKTGAETVVYSFCQTDCSDGDEPTAGLISVLGTLYGTTEFGGTPGKGTVFALKKPY